MKYVLAALLASVAAPAFAQQTGQAAPAQPAPVGSPICLPEHAAMGHCTPAAAAPAPAPAAQPARAGDPNCLPEHAAMGHCTPAAAAPAPVAAQPARAGDPNCLPEHAAMGHCTPAAAALPPAGPPPPAAFTGPEHAQDLVYDDAEAARSRRNLLREHGGLTAYRVLIDQAEVAIRDGREGYSFDAQAWYGGDIDKLWIKSQGEGTFGEEFEGAEVQALWSRAIDPWFDAQLGVRQDFQSGPDRTYLVAGIQGLAPYWFEVEGTMFLSNKGDLTARFEGEYDLRLTQALILQPLVEVDLALQDVPELGIGSGLSTAEIGARLRYEIFPSAGLAVIAPYIGVEYERAFGDTARFRRAAGEEAGGWSLLVGVRTWF